MIMNKIIFSIIALVGLTVGAKKMYYDVHDCEKFSVKSNLRYHTIVIKNGKAEFAVTKENEEDFDFYVNSNFFTSNAEAIGGVVIEGKRISKQIPGGGSFVVKNGKPQIVFGKASGCEYLSQSIIWAIKNGSVNKKAARRARANEKTMRILIGKNEDGEITVIHSNPFIFVTLSDIFEFAKKSGLRQAIVLDSGSSVDLKISNNGYTHFVKAVPSIVKKASNISEPVTYIAANF
jgi:hypothetical protein